jgi:hypothetical protein
MKKILESRRMIIALWAVQALILISFGAYIRPGITMVNELISSAFEPPRPIPIKSEYETAVDALWKSEKHQYTCRAKAAAFVSLELANKYLAETKKQQLIAEFELPESLVNEMAKNATSSKK